MTRAFFIDELPDVRSLCRAILMNQERAIVLVTLENTLIGVVTEGDLLRSLMKGVTMDEGIIDTVNTNPFFLSEEEAKSRINIFQFLRDGLTVIPVIDASRKVVEVISLRNSTELLTKESKS